MITLVLYTILPLFIFSIILFLITVPQKKKPQSPSL